MEMECKRIALRNAILRVWKPAVGARTFDEIMERNIEKIIDSQGMNFFSHTVISDHIPLDSVPRYYVNSFFDNKPPFEMDEVIISGSWSEGLFLHGLTNIGIPDLDRMCVLKHIRFSEDDQQVGNLALKEETPFVNAYITDENTVRMWRDFLVDDENSLGKRLSSKKLKEKLQENYKKSFLIQYDRSNDVGTSASMEISRTENRLPLLNLNFLLNKSFSNINEPGSSTFIQDYLRKSSKNLFTDCDIVLSILCDGWPACAKEWITRSRIWPSKNVVQKIIHDGFHIVPKSSTEGDFRLSFSYAETTLIENLTELQHKVLRSFKAVVKYHQNAWSPNIKEIITTYHLKTVAFWHFEKVTQDTFTEEFLVNHLVLLLQELAEGLRKQKLPMYFMPKVNLFTNVDDPEEVIDIAQKIEELSFDFFGILKAVENIAFGFGRAFGVLENMRKFTEYQCSVPRNMKGPGDILSHHDQAIQKVSTVLNSARNVFQCNPFNVAISKEHLAMHTAEEPIRSRLANSLKSNARSGCLWDTKEFIDLD